jgi:hypothetical protein
MCEAGEEQFGLRGRRLARTESIESDQRRRVNSMLPMATQERSRRFAGGGHPGWLQAGAGIAR